MQGLHQHIPVKIQSISHGEIGIHETVTQMEKIILASLGDQQVRMAAEDVVGGVEPNDREGEASAVYQFVRDRVRYTKDPKGMEYVQTPGHMLTMIQKRGQAYGDCDDKTVLGLSMLKNLGYDVAIRVAQYRPQGTYTHVYGLVKIKNVWMVFDATPIDKELGWEAQAVKVQDRQVKPYGWDMGELMGLGGMDQGIDVYRILNSSLGMLVGGLLTAYIIGKKDRGGRSGNDSMLG